MLDFMQYHSDEELTRLGRLFSIIMPFVWFVLAMNIYFNLCEPVSIPKVILSAFLLVFYHAMFVVVVYEIERRKLNIVTGEIITTDETEGVA